jgi:hypothetical protein
MSAAWESPVLGRVTTEPRVLAEDVAADGWAPGAREALELCRSWGEDRVGAI